LVQGAAVNIESTVAAGGTLSTTVSGGGHLRTNRLQQTGLTITGAGSRVTLNPAGGTSVLNALSIEEGATLDITTGALVIDYAGTSPAATVRQLIASGRGAAGVGNGAWTGAGITSSVAAAENAANPESRSVGYGENATLPLGPYTSFRGVAVDQTAVLITYTRTGDATLDGLVNDDDDVAVVGVTYAPAMPQPQWAFGDFDYNGFVDDNDVTLLGAFYQPGGEALSLPSRRPGGSSTTGRGVETAPPNDEDNLLDLLAGALAYQVSQEQASWPLARNLSRSPTPFQGMPPGRRWQTADTLWADW
jgi:hypothetical protein